MQFDESKHPRDNDGKFTDKDSFGGSSEGDKLLKAVNEHNAPEGWDNEKDQKEPVIFYRYIGKPQMITYKDFINNVSPSKDYDIAKLIRDRSIK